MRTSTPLDLRHLGLPHVGNSSPTQLPRHPRFQQTRRHCFWPLTSTYNIEMGRSWMRWKGDDAAVVLDLVPLQMARGSF
jgi:hypothetical protein